jgi:hypothetical protein
MPTHWRRNRLEQVVSPQAKVMIFERFDFTAPTRRGAGAAVRERLSPQWNNPDAKPRVALVDGSVDTVKIADLDKLANSTDVAVRAQFKPSGIWNIPNTILGVPPSGYSMGNDGLENGQNNTTAWNAYFWATRNGINGRDINR